MSIYSVNRTGSMALAQVVANESYKSEDIGRILYETQVNDMAFFEAVLACDFNELKSMREGTLLESEIASLNEASFKGFVNKNIDRLKAFWGKIKAVIENAIEKIATWFSTECKGIIAKFKQTCSNKVNSWTGSEDVRVYNHEHECFNLNANLIADMLKQSYNDNADNPAEIAATLLSSSLGTNDLVGPKAYSAEALKVCMDTITVNKDNVKSVLIDGLSSGRNHVKSLNLKKKAAYNCINAAINEIKSTTVGQDSEKNDIMRLNKIVSAYEQYVAIVAKTAIMAVREDAKSRSKCLMKVMGQILKSPTVTKEASISDMEDMFDMCMYESTYNKNLSKEEKKEVEELMNED